MRRNFKDSQKVNVWFMLREEVERHGKWNAPVYTLSMTTHFIEVINIEGLATIHAHPDDYGNKTIHVVKSKHVIEGLRKAQNIYESGQRQLCSDLFKGAGDITTYSQN